MATDIRPPRQNRTKVMLKPGFHLVDWMKLTQVLRDQRPPGALRKISIAELAEHKSKFDCWTAYKGKVYNITQYMAYHPGGEKQLMSGAGKDCTVQFNKFHAWVNAESMLSKCLLGTLFTEEETIPEGVEEEEEEEKQDIVSKKNSDTSLPVQIQQLRLGLESKSTMIDDEVILHSKIENINLETNQNNKDRSRPESISQKSPQSINDEHCDPTIKSTSTQNIIDATNALNELHVDDL